MTRLRCECPAGLLRCLWHPVGRTDDVADAYGRARAADARARPRVRAGDRYPGKHAARQATRRL